MFLFFHIRRTHVVGQDVSVESCPSLLFSLSTPILFLITLSKLRQRRREKERQGQEKHEDGEHTKREKQKEKLRNYWTTANDDTREGLRVCFAVCWFMGYDVYIAMCPWDGPEGRDAQNMYWNGASTLLYLLIPVKRTHRERPLSSKWRKNAWYLFFALFLWQRIERTPPPNVTREWWEKETPSTKGKKKDVVILANWLVCDFETERDHSHLKGKRRLRNKIVDLLRSQERHVFRFKL